MGLSFNPTEFQTLLRWRLGMQLSPSSESTTPCRKCGEAQDIFGDDAVPCKLNNYHARPQLVVDALARVLTSANIHTDREVPVNGKERPADILAYRLLGSSPLAIDVTVVHPLVSSSDLPQNRVSSAELSKHRHYDKLCSDAGLSSNACGFSTFGGAAPDAQLVLRKVKQRIAEIHGKAEGDILGNQAAERIVVSVMRGVAAQLIEATSSGASAIGPNDPAAIPLAATYAMRAHLLPACEAASGTREANNGMDVDGGFGEAPSLGHSQLVPLTTKTSPSSSNHVTPAQAALRADRPSESPTTHMRLDTPWRPARVLTISDGSVCDLSVSSRPPS